MGLKERFFSGLLDFFVNVVVQQYRKITLRDVQSAVRVADQNRENDMTKILINLLTSAAANPQQVRFQIL